MEMKIPHPLTRLPQVHHNLQVALGIIAEEHYGAGSVQMSGGGTWLHLLASCPHLVVKYMDVTWTNG